MIRSVGDAMEGECDDVGKKERKRLRLRCWRVNDLEQVALVTFKV
jgi:hypothetical protein